VSEAVEQTAAPASRRGMLSPTGLTVGLALLALLVCGAAGAAIARSGEVSYGSNTVLSIDQPRVVAEARDVGPLEKLNRLRLQYAALLRTAVVADRIAEETGLSPAEVSRSVQAAPQLNSLLIVITASAAEADTARELAEASAEALIDFSEQSQAGSGIPEEQRVELSVVSPPTPAFPLTRGLREVATVAVFLGLVGAATVYVLASLLSPRLRRR
jgi:capsular polysaccharide biosynthesis protein